MIPADLLPSLLATAGQIVGGLLVIGFVFLLIVAYATFIRGGEIE